MKKTSKPTEAKRCAIYTRKSTTMGLEQEFNSLDAQQQSCEDYVKRQPGWSVAEVYADGGFSGATIDRPAFQRLLADVDTGKVDVVVVYKVDRLSRSLLDFAQVMHRFNEAKVDFVSVTQNFSTADAIGRLTLNMMMSFAEFEREMIAERTRDKIRATRKKGKWTGGPVPLGYDLVDGKLVVNDLEAITVREIFSVYLERRSLLGVISEMRARGRMTKRYVTKAGVVRQAEHWDKRAVVRTLKNPIYAGRIPCKGEVYDGEHEAIVTPELFEQVQGLVGAGWERVELRPSNYLLKGVLRCGACGAAMTPASTTKKGVEYRYYRCKTRELRGADACPTRPLAAGAIENHIVERIRTVTADPRLARDVEAQFVTRLKQERAALVEEKRGLPGAVSRLSAEAAKLAESLVTTRGPARHVLEHRLKEVSEALERNEGRLGEVERALVDLEARKVHGEWLVQALRGFDRLWDVMTPENRHRLVVAVVETVVVQGDQELDVEVRLADLGGPVMEKAS